MENVTYTPKYEVVFFDLYGTLIDIRADEQCDAAWQALYDAACELGAQYDSVEVLRERFEKLEAREWCISRIVPSFAMGGTSSTCYLCTARCS